MSYGVIFQIKNVLQCQQKVGREKKVRGGRERGFYLTREFIQEEVLLLTQVKEC